MSLENNIRIMNNTIKNSMVSIKKNKNKNKIADKIENKIEISMNRAYRHECPVWYRDEMLYKTDIPFCLEEEPFIKNYFTSLI
jgi:hypothetical protein